MKGPFIVAGFFLITCSLAAQTNKWDARHETISRYVTEAGDRVDEFLTDVFDITDDPRSETFDRFYGDRRVEEEAKITRLKISPRVEFKDAQPAEFDVKFSIKLKLPRLKDRVQLIVDNLREDEEILDELQTKVDSNQDLLTEGDSSASVRVLLKETMNFRATFDTGLKFDPEPIPRVKLRLRAHRPLKHWTPRFTQSFFWESDDGFGEKTQFDLELERSDRYLLRLTTSALWSETSDGVEVAEMVGQDPAQILDLLDAGPPEFVQNLGRQIATQEFLVAEDAEEGLVVAKDGPVGVRFPQRHLQTLRRRAPVRLP